MWTVELDRGEQRPTATSSRSTACRCALAAGRDRRGRRPERLRQVDAARARVRAVRRPTRARCARPPAALMPQRDGLLPWLSALDNAGLALRRGRRVARGRARPRRTSTSPRSGWPASSARARAELSGGMRQRVAFLRTLLAGRPVLCLDEPFGALDALTRGQMQRWLADALAREPRTVLLVTHDVEEAVAARRPRSCCSRRGPGGSSETIDGRAPAPARTPRSSTARASLRALAAARGAATRARGSGLMAAAVLVRSLLAGWEALRARRRVDALLLPAPTEVAQALWSDRALLADDLVVTTARGRCSGCSRAVVARRRARASRCTCRPPCAGRCARW